jgi:hypothetical protein
VLERLWCRLGPCKVAHARWDLVMRARPWMIRRIILRRVTDQTLRCGLRLGPGPLRLSSGSALVRLELRASRLGAGSARARWDLVVRARPIMIRRIILRRVFVAQTKHQTLRCRIGLGPSPLRLSSCSALVGLELRAGRLGAGSARARWDFRG